MDSQRSRHKSFGQMHFEGIFNRKSKRKSNEDDDDSKSRDKATQTDFTCTAKIISLQSEMFRETAKFTKIMLNANFKLLKIADPNKYKNFEIFEEEMKKRIAGYNDLCNAKGDANGWEIADDELD